jgi:hypothetical protein
MKTSARCANIRAMIADDEELRKIALEMVDRMELLSDEDAAGISSGKNLESKCPSRKLYGTFKGNSILDPS